jgi:hypothetical protein
MITDEIKIEAMYILINGSSGLEVGDTFELLIKNGILQCCKVMMHADHKHKEEF